MIENRVPTTKEVAKATLTLIGIQLLLGIIVGSILALKDLFQNKTVSMQPSSLLIFLLIILANLIYMKFRCSKRPEETTPSFIRRLAFGITLVGVIISIIPLIFSLIFSKNFLAGQNTLTLSLIVIAFLALGSVFAYWINYTSLSFGNYLFNKQSISLTKFMVFSLIAIPLIFIWIIYATMFRHLSKDQWLTKLADLSKTQICTYYQNNPTTSQILNAKNISLNQCMVLISDSFNRCVNQYTSQIPDKLNATESKNWGRTIGKCTVTDFYDHNIGDDHNQ